MCEESLLEQGALQRHTVERPTLASAMPTKHLRKGRSYACGCHPCHRTRRREVPISRDVHIPVVAKDILRYFSLFGVPSLAPAVAMAKAEAAERALRLLSSSRHEVITTPLL